MNPSVPTNNPGSVPGSKTPPPSNAQIVSNIPVKNPAAANNSGLAQPLSKPAVKNFNPSSSQTTTRQYKQPDPIFHTPKTPVKQLETTRQMPANNPKQTAANNVIPVRSAPPIIATIIACLVALMMSAGAVYVYRGGF